MSKRREFYEIEERKRTREKKLKFKISQNGPPDVKNDGIYVYLTVEIFNISELPIHLLKAKIVFYNNGLPTDTKLPMTKENARFLGSTVYPVDPIQKIMTLVTDDLNIMEKVAYNPFKLIITDEFDTTFQSNLFQIKWTPSR
ncbi:hypothetical protein [Cyclobacterium salsum]|uniref:hypothetical protein n=1 Tax=Cyclobacterium salsum TaxID=2666329 RepID=UPI001391BE02|nr:hypothetical protein [Cyclobacterium salsum]